MAWEEKKNLLCTYFPSSSTSAGAVPALRASSNSFFLRKSSRLAFVAIPFVRKRQCQFWRRHVHDRLIYKMTRTLLLAAFLLCTTVAEGCKWYEFEVKEMTATNVGTLVSGDSQVVKWKYETCCKVIPPHPLHTRTQANTQTRTHARTHARTYTRAPPPTHTIFLEKQEQSFSLRGLKRLHLLSFSHAHQAAGLIATGCKADNSGSVSIKLFLDGGQYFSTKIKSYAQPKVS